MVTKGLVYSAREFSATHEIEVEREYILGVLRSIGGHKARAASELDIGTAALFRKLKQYGRVDGS